MPYSRESKTDRVKRLIKCFGEERTKQIDTPEILLAKRILGCRRNDVPRRPRRVSLQILNNLAESLGLGPRAQETLARLEKTTTRNLTKMIKRSQS